MTAHAPFWWAEGGAEYWSEEAGTNVWGTSREAFLRMTVAEDRVLSLDEWTTRIDKKGFTGERGYNHGYAFGRWLKTAVGAEAMAKMAEVSAERWHGSWEAVVEKATGRTLDDLYSAWRSHLDAHYGEQLSTIEEAGLSPVGSSRWWSRHGRRTTRTGLRSARRSETSKWTAAPPTKR